MEPMKKGAGWNFPVGVDVTTGKMMIADIKDDIRQSVLILLSTVPGERLLHGDYGCDLKRFMFEPISYELIKGIREEVLSSILKWEKRIQRVEVDILNDVEEETRIVISIRYMIRETMEADQLNYVYSLQ